jgi:hypothetical protein
VTICAAKLFSAELPFILRHLVGLDLEHVADGDLLDEIGRGRADAQARIDAGFFADRLSDCRCG